MIIELKKETISVYQMTLTKEEFAVLYRLLGNLSCRLVVEKLRMTKKQYDMTHSMYKDIDDILEKG